MWVTVMARRGLLGRSDAEERLGVAMRILPVATCGGDSAGGLAGRNKGEGRLVVATYGDVWPRQWWWGRLLARCGDVTTCGGAGFAVWTRQ